MPEKDPQTYTLLQYAWVVGLAVWGGAVGYLQKIRKAGEAFRFGAFISEMLTSSLAGVLAFFLCEIAEIGGLVAAILIAIAGHAGGEFVSLVKGGVWNRYGGRLGIDDSQAQGRKDGE